MKNICCCVFFSLFVVFVSESSAQTTRLDERKVFLRELTGLLLEGNEPVELEGELGWRGVVLVPVGTSFTPRTSGIRKKHFRTDYSNKVAESFFFDTPLQVKNGIGFQMTTSISEVWAKILLDAAPESKPNQDSFRALNDETRKWLFIEHDKVDSAMGLSSIREPSEYFLRYREYELLWEQLVSARDDFFESDSWKLHPRFSKYESLESAIRQLEQDWSKFGYRNEVGAALKEFSTEFESTYWLTWLEASKHFRMATLEDRVGFKFADSRLAPRPNDWGDLCSWQHFDVTTNVAGGKASFDLATVKIVRPWLMLDELVSGELHPRSPSRLSDGQKPSLFEYPKGKISVVPEQLIIARNIKVNDLAKKGHHPLASYVFPSRIQLVGYVVRAIPRIKN